MNDTVKNAIRFLQKEAAEIEARESDRRKNISQCQMHLNLALNSLECDQNWLSEIKLAIAALESWDGGSLAERARALSAFVSKTKSTA